LTFDDFVQRNSGLNSRKNQDSNKPSISSKSNSIQLPLQMQPTESQAIKVQATPVATTINTERNKEPAR
jgi:hypothetical protein